MKIFLFLILLSLSCKSIQDSKPIENLEDKTLIKKWIVTPDSGLNLREAPSRKARSIQLLPRGTMVTHKQLPENEKLDTIEDQKGKWLKVDFGIESGWVFDVYLSEPVFSPSGDKFYFVTTKKEGIGKIIKGVCDSSFHENEKTCDIEVRNTKNSVVVAEINHKGICCWYNNVSILTVYGIADGGGTDFRAEIFEINNSEIKNLYSVGDFIESVYNSNSKQNEDTKMKDSVCIFQNCLSLERNDSKLEIFTFSYNEDYGIRMKNRKLAKIVSLQAFQSF